MGWALLAYTLAIWAVGLAGVLVPLVMASYNKTVLTLLNAFAAGVMLSAGFVHLLHDAVASLTGLSANLGDFPISEFTCALSFICVFYIEALFSPPAIRGHHALDHIQVDKDEDCFPTQWEWQDGRHPSPARRPRPPTAAQYGATASSTKQQQQQQQQQPRIGRVSNHEDESGNPAEPAAAVRTGLLAHMQHSHVHHHDQLCRHPSHGDLVASADEAVTKHGGNSTAAGHAHRAHHQDDGAYYAPMASLAASHDHDHHQGLHTISGALCLLAALGFHSVIEGLGLATAASSIAGGPSTQVGVFLAILAHKGLAGITLGSTLLLAEVSQTQFLCTALLFSAATPLGVGLGVLVSSYCKSTATLGLMAAVAAGTFIHVAAIEIIPSAFRDTSATQFTKLASLTVGFLAMSALFLVAS